MLVNIAGGPTDNSPKAGRLRHKWLLLGHEKLLLLLLLLHLEKLLLPHPFFLLKLLLLLRLELLLLHLPFLLLAHILGLYNTSTTGLEGTGRECVPA